MISHNKLAKLAGERLKHKYLSASNQNRSGKKAIKWVKTAKTKNIENNHKKKQKLTSQVYVKGKFWKWMNTLLDGKKKLSPKKGN
jgi:hypothetical protein